MDSLPEELLFDILLRLPANFLHESAKLVCHKWHKIINSDDFIKTQVSHSSYGLLLLSSRRNHSHPIYVTATQSGRIETSELSYEGVTKIYGSCNGMVLESHQDQANRKSSLRLVNLATKQSIPVSEVSTSNKTVYPLHCGIAYSAASMKYKVIQLYRNDSYFAPPISFGICTIGVDKSWREVEISNLSREYRDLIKIPFPLTTEGFMHWSHRSRVLTLNVETETFKMSKVPAIPPSRYHYLSTGRYLNVFISRENFPREVWEMKPESGEWGKRFDSAPALKRFEKLAISSSTLKPLGWIKYPEILAFCFSSGKRGDICVFYNLDTHERSTVELPHSCTYYRVLAHRNNLVSIS